MLAILTASFIIMFASLIGVIFTWGTLRMYVEKNMGVLVSFSSGVFLAIIAALTIEIVEHSDSLITPLLWFIAGVLGVMILFKLLPAFHHHHDEKHEKDSHNHIDARKIVLSDAIHNIGDGILIAASFAVSLPIGIAAMISIFIHESIQEISEFFVLRQAGFSTQRALSINLLASSTILIGALGGYYLLETFEALEIPLLAISAGSFLVVVIQDLIPESIRHSKEKKRYGAHFAFFTFGALIMTIAQLFVSHGH